MDLDLLDLTDARTFAAGPPHEMFTELRRHSPVHRHERPGLPPFWVVSRYDDVVRVSRDTELFSSQRNGVFLDEPPDRMKASPDQTLINLDPPTHTRLRALVSKSFTAAAVETRERRVRVLCTMVLDRVSERGTADLVADIAAPFSLAVLAELVGFPDEADRRRVHRLTTVLSDPLEQMSPDAVMRATMELFELAGDLAAWRRKAPGDDLASLLAQAQPAGERLTTRQFELFFLLLTTAGHLTTQYLISGAMLALFQHPWEWERLRRDPGLLETGIAEMLRWVSPVMQFQRTATRDTEIGGQAVAAGERVALYYVSANRDETVFADPDSFDVSRSPNPQVSFGGGGPHFCLGTSLARLEVRILFEELLRRMPDIAAAGPPDHLGSTFVNGIRSMPVTFTPTPAMRRPPAKGHR